jgi:hypothetical protein
MLSCTCASRYVWYPLFLSDFNETWLFPTDFRKILKLLVNINPLGAEVFHADGRTDSRVEANCRFSQFFEGA